MARKKTDDHTTATNQSAMVQAIVQGVKIPDRLDVDDSIIEFLEKIIALRDFASWNESDLAKAVNLAQCQRDIVQIRRELREEGAVIENKRGTPVANPKYAVLETITRQELMLSRAIHVHAEATQGKSRDAGPKSRAQQAKIYAIDNAREKAKGLIPGI